MLSLVRLVTFSCQPLNTAPVDWCRCTNEYPCECYLPVN